MTANWQYRVVAGGPLLSDTDLAGLGADGWELVTVLAPQLTAIPVATSVAMATKIPPPGINPPSQSAEPVAYASNSFLYIFKQPGAAADKKRDAPHARAEREPGKKHHGPM